MVIAASTIGKDLVARLAPHHLELISSLIEAEVLQNDAIKKQLASKVNETLRSFGIQEVGAKPSK
jgi:hypothetical protein